MMSVDIVRFPLLLLVASFGVWASFSCLYPGGGGDVQSVTSGALAADSQVHQGACEMPGPDLAYWSESFRYGFEPVNKTVGLKRIFIENDPVTGDPVMASQVFSTGYRVSTAAARDSLDLFVAGVDRFGETIIQRWEFANAKGRYKAVRPVASTGIGVPALHGSIVESIVDPYLPADESPYDPPSRTLLYRDITPLGDVVSIAADPEGRFVLVAGKDTLSGDMGLFQIPLDGQNVPDLLFGLNSIPHLGDIEVIYPVHHQSQGRMYVIEYAIVAAEPVNDLRTLLRDPDNDGVFDEVVHLDPLEWTQNGYAGPVWDNLVDYRP